MRQQSGKCIAVNDGWEKKWRHGEIIDKTCIYKKNETFDFFLEDGWLYSLNNGEKEIFVQYAAFDKNFEILKDSF